MLNYTQLSEMYKCIVKGPEIVLVQAILSEHLTFMRSK